MSVAARQSASSAPSAAEDISGGMTGDRILYGDNLPLLRKLPDESVQMIYIDPPFNTGKVQQRRRLKTVRAAAGEQGDRTGFGGRRYRSEVVGSIGYADSYDDYLGFLLPRLKEAHRVLSAAGSLFFHIDWREAAHCRLLLEDIFGGSAHCLNEIIWAYDYGARSKKKWPAKHDNIYWFAKNPAAYTFNYEAIDRIPYMAPNLVGKEKAARGKTPTDTWWNTIVATGGREKTGYPTQKPLSIIERLVRVHSNPGDTVLDFFAGSGTTGAAAARLGRRYILIDNSKHAIAVARARLRALAH